MKLRFGLPLVVLLASVAVIGQDSAPTGFPADDSAYVSSYVPKLKAPAQDQRVKDEARGRREWMKERMGGELTAGFRDSMIAEANAIRARYPNAFKPGAVKAGEPGTWTNIGPARSNWIENFYRLTKSDTGRLRTILIHPSNPDVVYLLTSGGGLWKTTNYLSPRPTWAPKSDAILGTAGGSVAFGGNPNTLYLGSGDPFDGGVGGFVSKSTDGGETWSATVPVGISTTIQDIKVDTTTGSDIVFVATNAGLYRSTDGGASYHAISPIPTTGSHIAWSIERSSAGWLVTYTTSGFSTGGILLTPDRGNTFVAAMNGITGGIGRTTLGVGAPGDAVVYAYAATPAGSGAQKDLYRSNDGGQSWTALGLPSKTPVNPNEEQPDMNIMLGQAFYNHMLLVDPTDADRNTVYIGGQLASAKSTDGGATWRL
ncbi:MAG TPA: sialidase family protein, partial [Thermoanaerobaculia bacterium]|nr:sialidase family protein [Thermoanaerobaculia bacterium]